MDIRKRSFFKYGTGAEAAYKDLDVVASDLSALRKECDKQYELAAIFEFPQVCVVLVPSFISLIFLVSQFFLDILPS